MDWNNRDERRKYLEAFNGLGDIYGKTCSDFAAKAYFRALARFDIIAVVQAMEQAVTTCRFFPKPVELLEFIQGKPEDVKIAAEAIAHKVLAAAATYGKYATVQFDDPVTTAVIRQAFGGWASVCALPESRQGWFVRDFSIRYADYQARGIADVEPLRGLEGKARGICIRNGKGSTLTTGDGNPGQVRALARMTCKTIN